MNNLTNYSDDYQYGTAAKQIADASGEKMKSEILETDSLQHGKPTKRIKAATLRPTVPSQLYGADEPITFLIDGFMEDGTFNSIVGPSKSGKSMFALQMAFCVQNGIPFLGFKTNKADVLYVDFELRPNHIVMRLNNCKKYYNFPDAEEPLFLSVNEDFNNGNVDFPKIIADVRNHLIKNPEVKLVIFDCFYSWCIGSRNIESNVKAQLQPLKTMAAEFGICVCYVHHTSKSGVGKNPDFNAIINASGGSGVHGKIVDTTYVVYPAGSGQDEMILATAGRACSCGMLSMERTEETQYFFYADRETVQEVMEVDRKKCRRIMRYIQESGAVDVRHIKNKFHASTTELRDMGFGIDTKKNQIYFDPSRLLLPETDEFGVTEIDTEDDSDGKTGFGKHQITGSTDVVKSGWEDVES